MKQKYLNLVGIIGLDLLFLGAMLSWILSEFVLVAKIALAAGIVVLIVWGILSWRRAKQFIGKRSVSMGASTTVGVVFFAGILVIANVIGARYSRRVDLTKEKLFSLSDQTEKILNSLDDRIELMVFDNPDSPKNPKVGELAEEYDFRCHKISHRIIDPDREPQLAKRYGVSKYGQVVVKLSDNKFSLVENPTEQEITNAIKQLTSKGSTKVYFLTGHGEPSPYSKEPDGLSFLRESVVQEGFDADTLNLAITGKIPDDAAIVAMIGPRANPFPVELDSLGAFFERGGKLLLMLEPGLADSVASWLNEYGVEVGDNVVVDVSPVGRMFGASPEMPMVMAYDQSHAITKGFNIATMFPTVRSVMASKENKPGYRVVELAKTADRAWAETKWRAQTAEFNEGEDIKGPVPVACAVEKTTKTPKPRMVVFGDPDFVVNRYISFSGNKDLILNAVDWLGKQERLISIRPKNPEDRKLMLTPRQQQKIFYLSVVALPFLAIILAEVAWWRKQR